MTRLISELELGGGSSKLSRQGIQMNDDHLHFEELVKECTTESGRSIEHLDREIAERRRVESELKEIERRYHLLVDNISDYITNQEHAEAKISHGICPD